MNARDAIISALSALRMHMLRSALTTLGIVVGVAAVIAMVAVGSGAREQVLTQVRSLGTNLLIIWPGSVTQSGVRLGARAAATLTIEDAEAIMKEIPAVQVAAPILNGTVQVVAGGTNWATPITGADLRYFEARAWDIIQGRNFDRDETTRGAQVAVMGQTVARTLYGGIDPVGQEVRVANVPFRVVGVLAAKGQSITGQDHDNVMFLPLDTARQRVLGRNLANARAVNLIFVKVHEGESMEEAQISVTALLRERHRLQHDQGDDFGMRNLADIGAAREASAHTLALLLAAVAAVSLAVGGIGIMNIMLVSVTERTREIGLRLAVGARRRDILRQFLFEAIVLAAMGGAVGVVLGIAAAYGVAHSVGWPLRISPAPIMLAIIFSGIVGIFFGWYPAFRASRWDPIDALKHR